MGTTKFGIASCAEFVGSSQKVNSACLSYPSLGYSSLSFAGRFGSAAFRRSRSTVALRASFTPVSVRVSASSATGMPNGELEASSTRVIGASDLLIVGPGVLGRIVAEIWLKEHPGSQVYGQTLTSDHHNELIELGISPCLKGTQVAHKFPYVIFCAPPSRNSDYPGEVREATLKWNGEGSFLFTSSSATYDCSDNGYCDEVEQLHRIFKLCGSPSEEYWKKSKLPHATIFKPQQAYKRCIAETFKDFPPSSLPLIETLLAIDPADRQTATAALRSEFFTTKPYACDPSSLPKYPPSKEMDAKRRDEEARRLRATSKTRGDVVKKTRTRHRAIRGIPALEANAPLRANLDRQRLITHANAKSKSEKFPPPHEDGGLIHPSGSPHFVDPAFDPPDIPFSSMNFSYSKEPIQTWSGPLADPAGVGASRRNLKPSKKDNWKDNRYVLNKHQDNM
ncbi:UNVERIFIED_CONTAM: putative serine/threonine-protein kinase [Sesamum indicum]